MLGGVDSPRRVSTLDNVLISDLSKVILSFLRSAFALDVLRHQQMLTVVHHVGELTDPVAEDDHSGLFCQL